MVNISTDIVWYKQGLVATNQWLIIKNGQLETKQLIMVNIMVIGYLDDMIGYKKGDFTRPWLLLMTSLGDHSVKPI